MALNVIRLSASIKSLWLANPASGLSSPLTAAQDAMIKAQCDAIATAVVLELTANGQVVTITPGATAGPAALPGTGTIA